MYRYHMNAKDYSKDPYVKEWSVPAHLQGPSAGMADEPLSSVALQAQGYQVPQKPRPPLKRAVYGVSITQDPALMEYNVFEGKNQQKSLRDIRLNSIHGQRNVENVFTKPMADRSPSTVDQLYFRGVAHQRGRRILENKNSSSIERVFGLDVTNKPPAVDDASSNGSGFQGGKMGKRHYIPSFSKQNLISGNYGAGNE
eukprot:CAMPEP_0170512472 /NCGR_PEP_ID=MMETSP0208-20121228/66871_1 /TAXON_ID=197538 /ORGANISM="Strombidium inclinatum, Strain S3" /LENGTH=197 /DNA_ID=CAMNT_0010796105 /DNA_START=1057 /DNA_END=1647 /DNA_ORIENTATION=+